MHPHKDMDVIGHAVDRFQLVLARGMLCDAGNILVDLLGMFGGGSSSADL